MAVPTSELGPMFAVAPVAAFLKRIAACVMVGETASVGETGEETIEPYLPLSRARKGHAGIALLEYRPAAPLSNFDMIANLSLLERGKQ